MIGADLAAGRLHLQHDDHPVDDLSFDHLIVAAGAITNTFGIPGVDHHSFPLYNLVDAERLRNHVLERFEAADADPSLVDDGALTFVVVGGGPTGVEVAGALAELFQMVLRQDFGRVDIDRAAGRARRDARRAARTVQRGLAPPRTRHARGAGRRGAHRRAGGARPEPPGRVRRRRRRSPTHTLVWAAGVQANPVAAVLGVPTGRGGRIEVGRDLAVVGPPERLGDRRRRRHDRPARRIGRAAAAARSGGHAVGPPRRPPDLRTLAGEPTSQPFRYRDKGTMATIGRSRAVAELPLGIKLRGFPAWLAWLGLHLVMLAGFRNRISVFVNWAWNWLTYDRGPRLILREHQDR